MRHPQILVYERDGRLARLLGETAEKNRWVLREPRQVDHCLRLLREGGPTVLVLRVGSQLEAELGLLTRARRLRPDAAVFAVGDVENDSLAALSWELGANFALFPPQSRDLLPEIVSRWLKTSRESEEAKETPLPGSRGSSNTEEVKDAAP